MTRALPLAAARVAELTDDLYGELAEVPSEADRQMLQWAAHLHEIGREMPKAG